MPQNQKTNLSVKVSDRKLGGEWENWQGDIDYTAMDSSSGKRIFMGVLLLIWISWGGIASLIWYLISPRLAQFYPALPLITAIITGSIWIGLGLWFGLLALSLITRRDFLIHFRGRTFSLTFIIPIAFRTGSRLGISRDRLSNSFVNVSNLLIRTRVRKVLPEQLMIILPRCLHKNVLGRIQSISKSLCIPTYIVSGGSKARQVIIENRPKALIGVACERDLLSGIQDVLNKIPVIGIPNIRPEGPCKNTEINWIDFENALLTFLDQDAKIKELCVFRS
ncbi:DUF116 domain-containing protein [bacterium]|nr:DUF116 domain-containing protein [bacterium]